MSATLTPPAPPATVFQLLYASSATRPFSADELLALLDTSRRNNAAAGITGMLLYKDGNFMQVLEGDEEAVTALYRRIDRDPRHAGTLVLLRGHVPARQFADWAMGFKNLRGVDPASVPGYSEFLNTPLTGREFADPARAHKLMMTFKRTM